MPPRCPPGFPGWPPRRGARGAWVSEGACCARAGRGGGPMGSGWVLRPVMGSVLSPPSTINSSAPSWERREQRGEGAGGHLQPPASPRCPSRGRAPTGCRRAGAAGRAAPKVWGRLGTGLWRQEPEHTPPGSLLPALGTILLVLGTASQRGHGEGGTGRVGAGPGTGHARGCELPRGGCSLAWFSPRSSFPIRGVCLLLPFAAFACSCPTRRAQRHGAAPCPPLSRRLPR